MSETGLEQCPVSWGVSGFAVPRATIIRGPVIRAWNSGTAKPDRITAGLEGWNLEPSFCPFWAGVKNADRRFLRVIRLAEMDA
jgi:hypothetical protein